MLITGLLWLMNKSRSLRSFKKYIKGYHAVFSPEHSVIIYSLSLGKIYIIIFFRPDFRFQMRTLKSKIEQHKTANSSTPQIAPHTAPSFFRTRWL